MNEAQLRYIWNGIIWLTKAIWKGRKLILLPYFTTSVLSVCVYAQVHTYSWQLSSTFMRKSEISSGWSFSYKRSSWYVDYWLVSSDTSLIRRIGTNFLWLFSFATFSNLSVARNGFLWRDNGSLTDNSKAEDRKALGMDVEFLWLLHLASLY